MWWLALCLITMCLIEQNGIENIVNAVWFNIFSLSKCRCTVLCGGLPTPIRTVFEMVSAYGTVGLSLGIPTVRVSCLLYRLALTS